MARLSSPLEKLRDGYQVVVIGSGYGGGIAASRLARAGQQVCLLERGKEFEPGDFPDTPLHGAREMQFDLPRKHIGPRTALYDFRVNDDINVVLGCGLGGTSLINANVSLPADERAFSDPRWPEELRSKPAVLNPYYDLAIEMLRPTPYPQDFPDVLKLNALQETAATMQQQKNFYRPPININFQKFENDTNHVGVFQQPCKLCGDCVSGCNHSAKNTTQMNYLPDAFNHGAEIFTTVSVRRIERNAHGWLVHCELQQTHGKTPVTISREISAEIVILAAGTLGSTEILLRSAQHGLPLSKALGQNFTGNGDMMAFSYNNVAPINGIGLGKKPLPRTTSDGSPVGPCIAGIIDLRTEPALEEGFVIEEGTIPGALAMALPLAFATAASTSGKSTGRGISKFIDRKRRMLASLVRGSYRGAVHNTQTYLVMSHDDAAGRMYLDQATDRLRIDWKGVGGQPNFDRVNNTLEGVTKATGGTYVKNPISSGLFKQDVVTVHPLGGCPMADDAERGVVNHKSQVFCGGSGSEVHTGLYVCDGSVIPRSLGVNPLLTISALAERSIALMATERGWQINYRLPAGQDNQRL